MRAEAGEPSGMGEGTNRRSLPADSATPPPRWIMAILPLASRAGGLRSLRAISSARVTMVGQLAAFANLCRIVMLP